MPSLPLPFVLALVLAILLGRVARRADRSTTELAFLAFLALCAVQAVVTGLHWSYGWAPARILQPIVAATLPPFAFLAFAGLRRRDEPALRRAAPHLLPIALVVLLLLAWREALDAVLAAIFIGYGASLLWFARRGPNGLGEARIGEAGTAYRALVATGGLLIGSGLLDLAIGFELELGKTGNATALVALANLVTLALAAYAAAAAESSHPPAETGPRTEPAALPRRAEPYPESGSSETDAEIVAALDVLLRGRKLYRDPDLTLERLARRAGIPARRISAAVNRVKACNISQFVNAYRIAEAVRLLRETEEPVTTVMLEAGFQTKSNFNREFLRLVGESPSAYRRARADAGESGPSEAAGLRPGSR